MGRDDLYVSAATVNLLLRSKNLVVASLPVFREKDGSPELLTKNDTMNFTTQTGRDDYALRAFDRYKQDQSAVTSTKSRRYQVLVVLEAYDAFMSLQCTASELAQLFSGRGVDFRGTPKKRIAHYYIANDFSIQDSYPFPRLVEMYGCRNS